MPWKHSGNKRSQHEVNFSEIEVKPNASTWNILMLRTVQIFDDFFVFCVYIVRHFSVAITKCQCWINAKSWQTKKFFFKKNCSEFSFSKWSICSFAKHSYLSMSILPVSLRRLTHDDHVNESFTSQSKRMRCFSPFEQTEIIESNVQSVIIILSNSLRRHCLPKRQIQHSSFISNFHSHLLWKIYKNQVNSFNLLSVS